MFEKEFELAQIACFSKIISCLLYHVKEDINQVYRIQETLQSIKTFAVVQHTPLKLLRYVCLVNKTLCTLLGVCFVFCLNKVTDINKPTIITINFGSNELEWKVQCNFNKMKNKE